MLNTRCRRVELPTKEPVAPDVIVAAAGGEVVAMVVVISEAVVIPLPPTDVKVEDTAGVPEATTVV
jgi:hypothetical protein